MMNTGEVWSSYHTLVLTQQASLHTHVKWKDVYEASNFVNSLELLG